MAICGKASVMMGPILLTNAPSPQPPTGSHVRVNAKTSWKSGAMTKVGMVLPAVAVAITAFATLAGAADLRRVESVGIVPVPAGAAKSSAPRDAAVRAGERLSREEMNHLVDRLFATGLPHGDPHGRPTYVRVDLHELNQRFGRSD